MCIRDRNQDYFYECAQQFEDLYSKVTEKIEMLKTCPSSEDESVLKEVIIQITHNFKIIQS